eukprot:gnl/TRDRNA2_/TRDRNA2_36658_c0_seq1.p1 gnl/TRDRNA2_/TRDRNA2_36658_c0~~gnl/TRDRNA2_/TRDRNA2_36658_c0_seq1.p1  ORF type:complete len:163 (+),score=17.31 gnl/TRDRNA2_/TRDRNA2_36658_c0_seq1:72-491(+)
MAAGEGGKAYVVYRADIQDMDRYRAEYMAHTPGEIAKYGGRFLARGGVVETLEGDEDGRRAVLLEFPSADSAKRFYYSEAYQRLVKVRQQFSKAQLVIMGQGTAASGAGREHWLSTVSILAAAGGFILGTVVTKVWSKL